MMKARKILKVKICLSIISFILISSSVQSQTSNSTAESLQQDSTKQIAVAQPTDPNLRWQAYLDSSGLDEGVNEKNGRIFFIASGSSIVGQPINSKSFIGSRTIAYNKALLVAKSELAETISSELKSERGLKLFESGNEPAPALQKTVVEPLSIADKAHTLTSLALDDQIKKFDPTWDGTNKSKEEKLDKIAIQIERYTESLSQKAIMFLQGASPVFNAEGPVDGSYTVVVGLVWSGKFTKIAESLYNPSVKIPIGKKTLTVKDQIKEMLKKSPDSLAATMGVRVWRNENGERVVVSFAAANNIGSPIIAKKKTSMRGRSQIAQFISEAIVSEGNMGGGEQLNYYEDGSSEAFNEEKFKQDITARSKLVKLSGVASVFYWKGKHPVSNKRMVVNVMSWSPSSASVARGLEKMASDQETKMGAVKGGTISNTKNSNESPVGGTAVKGMSGAMSDPNDF